MLTLVQRRLSQVQREMSALYARFYGALLCGVLMATWLHRCCIGTPDSELGCTFGGRASVVPPSRVLDCVLVAPSSTCEAPMPPRAQVHDASGLRPVQLLDPPDRAVRRHGRAAGTEARLRGRHERAASRAAAVRLGVPAQPAQGAAVLRHCGGPRRLRRLPGAPLHSAAFSSIPGRNFVAVASCRMSDRADVVFERRAIHRTALVASSS